MTITENETKKGAGRPPKEMDWDKFESFMVAQCTLTEISGYFHIDLDTIAKKIVARYGKNFSDIKESFYSKGRNLLKAKRFEKALKDGNVQMLLKLGDIYIDEDKEANKGIKMADILERIEANQPKLENQNGEREIHSESNQASRCTSQDIACEARGEDP